MTVPHPEGVASIEFQGILKRWERRGMFTVMKSFGPQVRVTKISPKIKRLMTGI